MKTRSKSEAHSMPNLAFAMDRPCSIDVSPMLQVLLQWIKSARQTARSIGETPMLLILAIIFALGLPTIASAHAFLDHADPRVGSTQEVAPTQVTLYFTQAVEPAFSSVMVTDSAGKQVDKGDTTVDPNDGSKVTVSLIDLSSGDYKVEWKVTSVDTHKTHGSFHFTVKAKG